MLRVTSHMRLRARDRPLHFKHSHWWKRQNWSKFASLRLRGQWSMWMQDGCKVFLHGIMHGIEGIMFHGHLDYFQKPPPGGRPYTKPGDHGTPDVHNHRFVSFYFIMCEGACEWKFTEITFCRGPRSHILHTALEGQRPHLMILEVSWNGLGTLSFWALTILWSRHLARMWSDPLGWVYYSRRFVRHEVNVNNLMWMCHNPLAPNVGMIRGWLRSISVPHHMEEENKVIFLYF